MDGESWLIVISLIIIESLLVYTVFLAEDPVLATVVSIMIGTLIVAGAYKLEKYLGINRGFEHRKPS